MVSFNDTPMLNLVTSENQSLNVPEFPSHNGPQRLVAAATKQPRTREKVRLEPGHSPLDWAKLCSSGKDLRGVAQLNKYTLEDLREHRTPEDAWTAIQGKVYNITPYLKFHPGGVKDLMRCAGRDGTKLFMATHSWVNTDYLLDKCLVGFLVPSKD
ncbi:cytochrome b5-like heme/steroid binding domain-containing protein [Cokeromyces recurvatus]|uniref:cytochrome b5-like heme/steroid binding domain-containing protein n=1 Tax=Cokeromyces recurvatus TaxID=90255 RepID=UPI00221F1FB8|nr:cytochrome b5-like heme/steroid binding domain-containing protein [Cokeromyces recurvatus]KAI7902830.1 cytochrome b5-like heme/steroid binding domain-containing protein [Cokeromyces recurvatus]